MRFSSRVDISEPNPIAVEEAAAKRQGVTFGKLNDSNPTRHGLAPASVPEVYSAEPKGQRYAREALATFLNGRGNGRCEADDLYILSSTSEAYSWLIKLLCDAGDAVLAPKPGYPLIESIARLECVDTIEYQQRFDGSWYIDVAELREALEGEHGGRIRALILINPNNPTGSVATKEQLKAWVDYARKENAIILFDAAYEAFITDDSIPHSIFEIEGAKECAIEFRSFSKTAGFTGTRCGFTVVPKEVCGTDSKGEKVSLQTLWGRRQGTKFNGVPYVIQRAAEAVYSEEGKKQVKANIEYYLGNAALIKKGLTAAGFTAFGGENSPYVWVKTPEGMGSWKFFDYLLETYAIVTTPGEGFGRCGEGYIRFSALGSREVAEKAVELLSK